MANYVLSANARKSLREIKAYSTRTLGAKQTTLYLKKLRDRMAFLAEKPRLGEARDDIKMGYYSYPEGSHTIYYKIFADHIAVIDVLHQSMEPSRHL
jgi:toxin ParE1/3/4